MEIVNFVDGCRREKAWAYFTTKGCVAVIPAFQDRIEGCTVFTHPAMHEYLQGAKRLDIGRAIKLDTTGYGILPWYYAPLSARPLSPSTK